jgi:rifampicin phosphotransferase
METLVLPFSSGEATLSRVGGKGANLAELTRAGFAVLGGFLVTTDAYRQFVTANDIATQLSIIIPATQADDPRSLDGASDQIRALFSAGILSPEIEQAICAAYNTIGPSEADPRGMPVAVRSSATAEDLPGFSFAGQQDTYLNIIGVEAVLESVKQCWGSLWTARAIGYRARNHIPHDEVALAVVVQRMIAAEVSGVLFTANPFTGRRDEIVIDASYGLGEAIVSGQVEPDHYAIDPNQWHITRRKLGAKGLAIVPRQEGGTERITPDASQDQALSDLQILTLARISQQVAVHFGSSQDIEWAWASGHFHLLQSRPITSLYPLPVSPAVKGDLQAYISLNSAQGVMDPFTPLGADNMRLFLSGVNRILPLTQSFTDFIPVVGGACLPILRLCYVIHERAGLR